MKKTFWNFFTISLFSLLFALNVNAQTENNTNSEKSKTAGQKESSEECSGSGVVRLKVTFHKSGKVTKAEMVFSAGCKRIDEQAMKAAYNIKFEPAKKNGKPVTSVKVIEYTFTVE